MEKPGSDLLWEDIVGGGEDVGHEGAVLDVLVVADHVDGVVAGLRGPVAHVARAVALVVALDLGLRRALDGEACRTGNGQTAVNGKTL